MRALRTVLRLQRGFLLPLLLSGLSTLAFHPGLGQADSPPPISDSESTSVSDNAAEKNETLRRYRDAVEKGLPLLQSSAETWFEKRACFSCHHQALGTMAVSIAKEVGFEIDEDLRETQLEDIVLGDEPMRQFLLQGTGIINGPISIGIELPALYEAAHPPSKLTNAMAHYLAGKQSAEGNWYSESHRPPLEDSEYTATAFSLRALQTYTAPSRARELAQRQRLAREWLAQADPRTTEDRTMHLLALGWAEADLSLRQSAAKKLLAEQREDGGWSQLPFAPAKSFTSQSDVYATSQALVALNQAAEITSDHPALKRGYEYLLKAQKDDGSWHVKSRIRTPANRYFESGFPHGKDQFISYAGSSWATLALALATEDRDPQTKPRLMRVDRSPHRFAAMQDATSSPDDIDGMTPLMETAISGSLAEMEFILGRGADVNAKSKEGLTALMCAVHDPEKVDLLLTHGADPAIRSNLGYNAAVLAGGYSGSMKNMVKLFAMEEDENFLNEGSAFFLASEIGDEKKMTWLLERGANIDVGKEEGMTPLHYAARQGDETTLAFLLSHGADRDARTRGGTHVLGISARYAFSDQLRLLLKSGAPVDITDEAGMTPLMWAARFDPGHTETTRALLNAGANPEAKDKEGRTAKDHSRHLKLNHSVTEEMQSN